MISTLPDKASKKSIHGREVLISLTPALLIALWFVIVDLFELYVTSSLSNRFLTTTLPVMMASLVVGVLCFINPIVIRMKSLFTMLLPSLVIYPIVCFFFILRYRIVADGAIMVIYEFAIGGFGLSVGVAIAVIIGSWAKTWFKAGSSNI